MFDPYRKWLGIPPKDQPPNHYRLLALELFESDLDVIEGSADKQMGHVRQYQSGEHAAAAAKILNELAVARLCLLKPATKAAYDEDLRRKLAPVEVALPDFSKLQFTEVSSTNVSKSRVQSNRAGQAPLSKMSPQRIAGAGIGAVVCILLVVYLLMPRHDASARKVPTNVTRESAIEKKAPAASATLPSATRSEPGVLSFPKGKAVPVPGFEDQTDCFSVCLTPDLKQIVIGKITPGSAVDLYLCTRAQTTEPFGRPKLIESTLGPETEAYPSISPDGLELYFIRSDVNPMIWVTRRSDLSADFGPAEKWSICQADEQSSRLGTPQVISKDQVLFSRISMDTRSIWSSVRRLEDRFSLPELYATPPGNPTVFFSPSGFHAYFGGIDNGLFLLTRPNPTATLGELKQLLDGAATGPIDGTIWISPQEDLAFYCSPGPGEKPGSGHRLWMIAF